MKKGTSKAANGYIKKSILSGPMLEITKSVKADRPGRRGEKRRRTPEEMQAANRREREKKLTRLIAANFSKGDYFLVLTFREEPDEGKLSGMLAKFFRKLRKKAETVKYILCIEKGSRGGRLHCHLLLNKEVAYSDIAQAWEWGQVRSSAVYSETDFRGLAQYILKSERGDGEKAWRSSRNLHKPVEKVKKVSAKSFRKTPAGEIKVNGKVYKLESAEEHFDPFTMENVQYAVYFCREWREQDGKESRRNDKRLRRMPVSGG